MNIRMYKQKDESYIPLGINAEGITTRNPFFYWHFLVQWPIWNWWNRKALVNYVQLHQTWPIKQVLKKQIFWSSTSSTWDPLNSVAYILAMETSGPKSNSSELLCLSLLPATLMMIRSKMNELAWRHHFPITCISLSEIFKPHGN